MVLTSIRTTARMMKLHGAIASGQWWTVVERCWCCVCNVLPRDVARENVQTHHTQEVKEKSSGKLMRWRPTGPPAAPCVPARRPIEPDLSVFAEVFVQQSTATAARLFLCRQHLTGSCSVGIAGVATRISKCTNLV